MKSIFILINLFAFCQPEIQGQNSSLITDSPDSNSEEIQFYGLEVDFEDFKEFARSNERPFFVDFYASWCTPCKLMDELVYSDSAIVETVNSKYFAYKVNIEYFTGMDLSEKYEVKTLPTLLFFNAEGEMLGKEAGVFTADGFRNLLIRYLEGG